MEFGVWGVGCGVWGLGFRVWGLGFRVEDLEGAINIGFVDPTITPRP